jgi:hypothetical protein
MFAVWEKPDIEKGSIATDGLKNLLVFTLVKVDVWHSHASVSFFGLLPSGLNASVAYLCNYYSISNVFNQTQSADYSFDQSSHIYSFDKELTIVR